MGASTSNLLRLGLVNLAMVGILSGLLLWLAWWRLKPLPCLRQAWKSHVRCLMLCLAGFFLGLLLVLPLAQDLRSQTTGIDPRSIERVEGRLATDAIRSQSGWRGTLVIDQVATETSISCQARFTALAFFDGEQNLHAGCRVVLSGVQIKPVESRSYGWQVTGRLMESRNGTDLEQLRSKALDACETALQDFPVALRGFMLALLLGRQDELDPDMQKAFYGSGCAHLVALSGMHIALVAALLVRLLQPSLGIVIARCTGFIGALVFIWLVGPFPSAIRALIMFAILQFGALTGRRISGIAALCLTGPILGTLDPMMPLSLGFQLSFWALLGIMVWQDSFQRLLRKPLLPLVSLEISTGISAQACTAPLLWARGLVMYPQGIVAGMILAPLVLLFMALAVLALLVGMIGGSGMATLLQLPLGMMYSCILSIGSCFAR